MNSIMSRADSKTAEYRCFGVFLLHELILEYGGDIMKQEFRRKEFIQMKATKKMMKSITWRVIFK